MYTLELSYYTIGMAGHIDHGKTSLTKALTTIDTDRLKEEKERNISIELGFAPLKLKDDVRVSIVDVPGHERFIRQMIAGVAGIDLVMLVVAADEGVMPQTKEHIEILEFLGIERCIVVVTKVDKVDKELMEFVEAEIKEELTDSGYRNSPFVYVNSISGEGIEKVKELIFTELVTVKKRNAGGSFRLPIDHVFTLQGHGTIVRGTIYEGMVQKGSELSILPEGLKVKARQIQVHQESVKQANAGQRAAINLSSVNKEQIKRGDVLVDSNHFLISDTVDVTLKFVNELAAPIKQRAPVRIYIGTSEVSGKIIFYDRNAVKDGGEEVLCQIKLEEAVVVRRGDRFILRRPTPVETLGGGWIIQPNGSNYRFGDDTIRMLQNKKAGSPEDLIQDALSKQKIMDRKQLIQMSSVDGNEADNVIESLLRNEVMVEVSHNNFVLVTTLSALQKKITSILQRYHEDYTMRVGMDKAELVQFVSSSYPNTVIEYCLTDLVNQTTLFKSNQFLAIASFQPAMPSEWKKRMSELLTALEEDGSTPKRWDEYVELAGLPQAEAVELKRYVIMMKQVYPLTDEILIHRTGFQRMLGKLKKETKDTFKLKEAKEALGISRKYLIPFLDLLDELNVTVRHDEERKWNE
ncbi:selenocysteine-specific translation elongation factor [Virgibacillus flavescens]|uniref:selenocysteine-specific translation elongation factor n=1 Tax=Virgibacillus flavescens TaxID=1611422 RepID=UPI003D338483